MRVLVFGTFDQLHPGHRFLLHEAQKRGECWVVVARDETVLHIKGREPVQSAQERMEGIQSLFPDCHVILGDEADYLAPVRSVKPGLILLGYDQNLPPGVTRDDLHVPIERIEAFEPEKHKSSKYRP